MAFTVGWVYNLKDPNVVSRASTVIALALSFPILAIFFYATRIGVRLRAKRLGLDDLAATCSLKLLNITYSTTTILQTRWGLGLNLDDIPSQNVETFSKLEYVGGPIYCLAVLGFKLSLLLSYLRIAGGVQHYEKVLYGAITLVSINQVMFAFLLSCACNPVAKQWNPSMPGSCIHQLASYFALGGTSLGFDLLVIALPFPILMQLHLSKAKKVAVALLFALGFFITIIQVIRIFYIANLADYTNSQKIIEWSAIEINLGVIIASIQTHGKAFNTLLEWGRCKRLSCVGAKDGSEQRGGMELRRQRYATTPSANSYNHIWAGDEEGMESQ